MSLRLYLVNVASTLSPHCKISLLQKSSTHILRSITPNQQHNLHTRNINNTRPIDKVYKMRTKNNSFQYKLIPLSSSSSLLLSPPSLLSHQELISTSIRKLTTREKLREVTRNQFLRWKSNQTDPVESKIVFFGWFRVGPEPVHRLKAKDVRSGKEFRYYLENTTKWERFSDSLNSPEFKASIWVRSLFAGTMIFTLIFTYGLETYFKPTETPGWWERQFEPETLKTLQEKVYPRIGWSVIDPVTGQQREHTLVSGRDGGVVNLVIDKDQTPLLAQVSPSKLAELIYHDEYSTSDQTKKVPDIIIQQRMNNLKGSDGNIVQTGTNINIDNNNNTNNNLENINNDINKDNNSDTIINTHTKPNLQNNTNINTKISDHDDDATTLENVIDYNIQEGISSDQTPPPPKLSPPVPSIQEPKTKLQFVNGVPVMNAPKSLAEMFDQNPTNNTSNNTTTSTTTNTVRNHVNTSDNSPNTDLSIIVTTNTSQEAPYTYYTIPNDVVLNDKVPLDPLIGINDPKEYLTIYLNHFPSLAPFPTQAQVNTASRILASLPPIPPLPLKLDDVAYTQADIDVMEKLIDMNRARKEVIDDVLGVNNLLVGVARDEMEVLYQKELQLKKNEVNKKVQYLRELRSDGIIPMPKKTFFNNFSLFFGENLFTKQEKQQEINIITPTKEELKMIQNDQQFLKHYSIYAHQHDDGSNTVDYSKDLLFDPEKSLLSLRNWLETAKFIPKHDIPPPIHLASRFPDQFSLAMLDSIVRRADEAKVMEEQKVLEAKQQEELLKKHLIELEREREEVKLRNNDPINPLIDDQLEDEIVIVPQRVYKPILDSYKISQGSDSGGSINTMSNNEYYYKHLQDDKNIVVINPLSDIEDFLTNLEKERISSSAIDNNKGFAQYNNQNSNFKDNTGNSNDVKNINAASTINVNDTKSVDANIVERIQVEQQPQNIQTTVQIMEKQMKISKDIQMDEQRYSKNIEAIHLKGEVEAEDGGEEKRLKVVKEQQLKEEQDRIIKIQQDQIAFENKRLAQEKEKEEQQQRIITAEKRRIAAIESSQRAVAKELDQYTLQLRRQQQLQREQMQAKLDSSLSGLSYKDSNFYLSNNDDLLLFKDVNFGQQRDENDNNNLDSSNTDNTPKQEPYYIWSMTKSITDSIGLTGNE